MGGSEPALKGPWVLQVAGWESKGGADTLATCYPAAPEKWVGGAIPTGVRVFRL